MLTLYFLQ